MVRIEYIRVFNLSNTYQITCADVSDRATDLQIIELLLQNENADTNLARITKTSGELVNVEHPRYSPTFNNRGYQSRISWVLAQDTRDF